MKNIIENFSVAGRFLVAGAPQGFDALVLGEAAAALAGGLLVICREDARMVRLAEALAFFAPTVEVLTYPAWDCLPYDRVSPRADIVSHRIDTLSRLGETSAKGKHTRRIVLTTVSAALQRVVPRAAFDGATLAIDLVAKGFGYVETAVVGDTGGAQKKGMQFA